MRVRTFRARWRPLERSFHLDQIFLGFPTIGILMNLRLSCSDRAAPWKA
jgi:hypothetical protein